MDLLDEIIRRTDSFILEKSKNDRKKIGQFFTDKKTALFMASLFDFSNCDETIRVLDPGTGSGILSAGFIEIAKEKEIKKIHLTFIENNEDILELLRSNIELFENIKGISVSVTIIEENYITLQNREFSKGLSEFEFDFIISNPPYLKISRNAPETFGMDSIIHGAPNLYFLFIALSVFNLRTDGELVYIIPRSWTSGAYFTKFRNYFFSQGFLMHVHLFASRSKSFEKENILQETMIIKFKKTKKIQKKLKISSSADATFGDISENFIDYSIAISGENKYLFLPVEKYQIHVLEILHQFNNNLMDFGIKLKTGVTVDFRNKNLLREVETNETIPLIYSSNIVNGKIDFPTNHEKFQYLIPEQKSLAQENKDYLMLKRFSSKEEKRRLQPAIYISDTINSEKISTDNKINFIERIDKKPIDREILYGLYVLFSSTVYDDYYRILNGSTQVNATEINNMPLPSFEQIRKLGTEIIKQKNISTFVADNILNNLLQDVKMNV